MQDRKDITVPMPQWEVELINKQLGYNDSRAAWMRAAALEKLEREGTDISEEDLELARVSGQFQPEV
jgi:hypothetical protein